MKHDDGKEIGARIAGLFLDKPRKRKRVMPRCLGCGKVSKHIFHNAACKALYDARKGEAR